MKNAWRWSALAAFLGPIAFSLVVDRQGFDLIEDGRWLYATEQLGRLYDGLESSESPARVLLLAAFAPFLGLSAFALVGLRALLAGIVSLAFFDLLRRHERQRLAVFAPLLLLATPPPSPEIALVAVALWAARSNSRLLVALAAVAPLFGPGPWLVVLLLGALTEARRPLFAASVAGFALLGIVGGLLGAPVAIYQQTLFGPLGEGLQRLREGSAMGWWQSLRGGPFLRTPYAGLATGETPQILLPAHGSLRLWASFLLYAFALGVSPWLAWRTLRERRLMPWTIVAFYAAWLLLLRGDLRQLQICLLGGAVLAPIALLEKQRLRVAAILLAIGLAPTLGERVILAATQGRDSLVLWEEPRARVLIGNQRMLRLNALGHELTHDQGPLFVWPPAAGLNFLSDRPPATRALLPRAGANRLGAEIAASAPTNVLLAPSAFLGSRPLGASEPALLDHLRRNYRLLGSISGGVDEYRGLSRLSDPSELAQLPLPERLPVAELTVGNDVSPPLRANFTVGQSVRMGDGDLGGLSLRWSVSKAEIDFRIRVRIWMKRQDRYDVLLDYFDTDVYVPRDGYRSYLRFGPIENTAGLDLALTVELLEDPDAEVRLLMHRHDGAGRASDLFQTGSALFNEEPVDADLVFAVY